MNISVVTKDNTVRQEVQSERVKEKDKMVEQLS